jgi:hypothetical protein
MLKLKDVFSNVKKICNESDYYIKIKLLFEDKEFLDGICYWSTLDSKGSLMEIGLEESTGLIFEICVVICHTTYQQDLTIVHNNVSEKAGLPLFETDAWKPKVNPLGYHVEFYDPVYNVRESNHFEIYAGQENTTILFSSNTVVLHVINYSVIFGFDVDNNLCYIRMQNMALNEEGFLEATEVDG